MRLALPTIALIITFLSSCSKNENFSDYEDNIENPSSKTTLASSETHNEIETELFNMINNHRSSIGLNEMEFESTTYYYAGLHTDYMIENGTTSHVKFGERAENISKRTGAVFVAENVAKDYDTTTDAFEAWLDSPGHRKNLEGNFDYSAVSIKRNSNGDLYFTQVFFR